MRSERRRIWICLLFAILVTVLAFVSGGGAANTYTVCPDGGCNYTKIQDAIDAANPLDTIIVRDGIYPENVDVDVAHLTIRSENGSANCVVVASDQNDHVFSVTANWVNISGFRVQNAGSSKAGIYLGNVDHCTISENTASNNNDGINVYDSSTNTLAGNTVYANYDVGIFLQYSSNNNLTGNTASDNDYGIDVESGSNTNNLTGNTASDNDYGIYLYDSSNNNTLTGNTANSNNDIGIRLSLSSNNNTLTGNTANSNNNWGISLFRSSNNNLTGNTANSNNNYGIRLWSSSNNNLIYNNSFNNQNNAWDDGTNSWNITKTEGRNIIGGPFIGGNYWSDYDGNDTNGDGLGDTPYDIPGGTNKDYLPLIVTAPHIFDTDEGDYPSISGTHNGTLTITPFYNINVSKMYTYPCPGTGGHTEYVKIWNNTHWNVTATWNGYTGDWHNITFNNPFTLYANETYNYTIRTGSYPQIIHADSKDVTGGRITSDEFIDINGKRYNDWIPAIRLF